MAPRSNLTGGLTLTSASCLIALATPMSSQERVRFDQVVVQEAAARPARAHRPPRPRIAAAVRPRATLSPGAPPGPGYCWYYIDRSTSRPGFWDICRGR